MMNKRTERAAWVEKLWLSGKREKPPEWGGARGGKDEIKRQLGVT
jgi:hypothetical protein